MRIYIVWILLEKIIEPCLLKFSPNSQPKSGQLPETGAKTATFIGPKMKIIIWA